MGGHTIKLARVKPLLTAIFAGLFVTYGLVSALHVSALTNWVDNGSFADIENTEGGLCHISTLFDGTRTSDEYPITVTIHARLNGTLQQDFSYYVTVPEQRFTPLYFEWWNASCAVGSVSFYDDATYLWSVPYRSSLPTAIPDPTDPAATPFAPTAGMTRVVAIPTALPIPSLPPSMTTLNTDPFWNLEYYESMISVTQSIFKFAFLNDAWEIAGFLLAAYLGIRLLINFASRGNEVRKRRQREEV